MRKQIMDGHLFVQHRLIDAKTLLSTSLKTKQTLMKCRISTIFGMSLLSGWRKKKKIDFFSPKSEITRFIQIFLCALSNFDKNVF